MNTHNHSRLILCVLLFLFIGQLPFFSAPASETIRADTPALGQNPDLLIIISPQYAGDNDLHTVIQSYMEAVNTDLGWTSQSISIHPDNNTYQTIDHIIETTYQHHPLKACIMVGEDLDTPLGGDCDGLEQPSTLPWMTMGETTSYTQTTQGILCVPSKIQLCVSLLYPPSHLSYEQKKAQLLFAFTKFSSQRYHTTLRPTRIFESSALNTNSKPLYQHLATQTQITYTEDATDAEIIQSLQESYTAYFIHGHSNPAGSDLNRQNNSGWFTADYLDSLNTPLFGADGCYTAGWWSDQDDNNRLDPSIKKTYYSSKIFTSTTLQVLVLGLLSQNGCSTPVSFIENVLPELYDGKTLAEAMTGDWTIGDYIIVGDPTFHYTVEG
jgi:hypothetical protein